MGKPVIGEVVVLPFPQTHLQAGKRRPALVVADLAGDDLMLYTVGKLKDAKLKEVRAKIRGLFP